MTELGQLSCWVALLMAVWGAALSCVGALTKRGAFVASGSRGVHAAALFVALASAGLGWALLTGDFSLRYVAAFTNEVLPLGYRLSAFWAGRAGSTLLAALLLSACVPVAVAAARRRDGAVAPWVTTALGAALALLLSALAAGAAPFGRFDVAPVDGRGLDPALQHPGMAILRPLAYLGYAATLVALAHALAAFASRRLEGPSPSGVRPWLIAAWCALGASVLLALRVGYAEPGSGGYWPWRAPGAPHRSSGFDVVVALSVALAVLVAGARVGRAEEAGRARRRRWAALVAGLTLLTLGFAGTAFRSEHVVSLADGESWRTADPFGRAWSFTSQGASRIERPSYFLTSLALRPERSGVRQPFLTTEWREFYGRDGRERFPPFITSGLRGSWIEDVSVMLVSLGPGRAVVRISFVPLAGWVWFGGTLALAGGALILAPVRSRERADG